MAKCKYFAKENKKVGTHSYYAVAVPVGTLTFNEVSDNVNANNNNPTPDPGTGGGDDAGE